MAQWTKLALEGGGAKGYVYIGVAKALEEKGILKNIQTIAGSSVGSIGCLLLSCGFSLDKLQTTIFNTDFQAMVYDCYQVTAIWNLLWKGGLHEGLLFHQWFGSIIESVTGDKDTTFAQWHDFKERNPDLGLKDMIVEACNMSTRFNDVFAWYTAKKDTPIRDALRASMAFPYLFTPWKIGDDLYQDGGIQSNLPIAVFNDGKRIDHDALGIWLTNAKIKDHIVHGTPLPHHKTYWMYQRLMALLDANFNEQLFEVLFSPYQDQLVFCDTKGVGTLDFGLSFEKKEELIASGYDSVIAYLNLHPEPQEFDTDELADLLEQVRVGSPKSMLHNFDNMKQPPRGHTPEGVFKPIAQRPQT